MVLPNTAPTQRLVGWTAFVPFSYISEDGSRAEVGVVQERERSLRHTAEGAWKRGASHTVGRA